MQSLNGDEEKQVLGEILADKRDAILDYVKDIPTLGQELHKVHATVDEINDRLTVIEHVVREHESEINHLSGRLLKQRAVLTSASMPCHEFLLSLQI